MEGLFRQWAAYLALMVEALAVIFIAGIIRTAISPTWTQIGQLGAIAVIRTFLNHFLEEELEKYKITSGRVDVAPPEQKAA